MEGKAEKVAAQGSIAPINDDEEFPGIEFHFKIIYFKFFHLYLFPPPPLQFNLKKT